MTEEVKSSKLHEHEWECVAPEGGYYRWQCKTCPETKPYPDVPAAKGRETWKERCEREAGYSR